MNSGKTNLLSNIGWMTFDKVLTMCLNLFVTVRMANYFGTSRYGDYQYALSAVAVLEILVTFVDGRVAKKKYSEYDENLVVCNVTLCKVMLSVVAAAIGVTLLLIQDNNVEFTAIFSILLLNSILVNLRSGMVNRFEFHLKSRKTVIVTDCATIISAVLQLVAVKEGCGLIAISVILTLSSMLNLVMLYVQYRHEFTEKEKNHFESALVKELLLESVPLGIAASCSTIYTKCDSLMLKTLMSSTEVGIYSIAIKLISVVQIVLSPIRESVFPKMIQLYNKGAIREYDRYYLEVTSALTWIYVIISSGSFALIPVIRLLFREEYAESFKVYALLAIGTLFVYNGALRAGHYTIAGKAINLTFSQLISVVLNVIINVAGIKTWGIYGAALATVVAEAFSLLFSNLLFGLEGRRVFSLQFRAMNPVYAVHFISHWKDMND